MKIRARHCMVTFGFWAVQPLCMLKGGTLLQKLLSFYLGTRTSLCDDLPSSTDRYFFDSTGVPLHLIGTNNRIKYFIVIK